MGFSLQNIFLQQLNKLNGTWKDAPEFIIVKYFFYTERSIDD